MDSSCKDKDKSTAYYVFNGYVKFLT